MSDIKDKTRETERLSRIARDLDLDMDAPLGSAFAAALRDDFVSEDDLSAEELYRQLADEGLDADADELVPDDGTRGLLLTTLDAKPSPFASAMKTPPETVAPLAPPLATPAPPAFDDGVDGGYLVAHDDEMDDEEPPPPAPPASSQVSQTFAAPEPVIAPPPLPTPARPSAAQTHHAPLQQASYEPPMPTYEPETVDTTTAPVGEEADAEEFGAIPSDGGDRIIPRISIHSFCLKTGTLGLMRRIQADRRLKNVAMEVLEGGIPAAIQYYAAETTPNLLILEGSNDPRQLLNELDTLAEYCDENIRVLILGETNDIRFYRELMNRGVSEYLVKPVDPVQLIRSIANLFTDPEAPFTGKTLAVTGVKGGVGASCIAHNLAWALSERIKVNATLVDLDLNFGTTGLDFNQDVGATIADALMSPDRFDEAVMARLVTKATERLSLFTAPASLDRTYNLDPETYIQVLEQVRSSVPFVVLDMPHIWSDWFKSTLIGADEILVVAAPELASLRNGKNLVDFLKAARPNDSPPRLVLNMVGVPKRPEIPPKDFGQAIGLEPSMVIPFEPQLFGTASNNGQMIFDVAPESKCSQAIDHLAGLLSGKTVQAEKPSLIKKILRR